MLEYFRLDPVFARLPLNLFGAKFRRVVCALIVSHVLLFAVLRVPHTALSAEFQLARIDCAGF